MTWNRRKALVDDVQVPVRPRARRRWARLLVALLLLLLVVVAAAWLQRRTIARGFIDRELARRGVPARYEITQLSPWRQRLTNVVIGDPRRPDLVADWIEVRTALAPWRAELLAVRTGSVRLRGRLVDGRVSLGTLDRLMPAPSGKPFVLPALIVEAGDVRVALETPAGAVQLAIAGKGLLTDGFRGTATASAARLALAGCAVDRASARLTVHIRDGAPELAGPLSAAAADCSGTHLDAPSVAIEARGNAGLDRWTGTARLAADTVAQPGLRLATVRGDVRFGGDKDVRGTVTLGVGAFDVAGNRGRSASLEGRYVYAAAGSEFTGRLRGQAITAADSTRALLARNAATVQAGPLQPIADQLARSTLAAAKSVDADADLRVTLAGGGGVLALSRAELRAASGAYLGFTGDAAIGFGEKAAPLRAQGMLALRGGGMPQAELRVVQGPDGVRGQGRIAPYAAGGAQLALADLGFRLQGPSGEAQAVATFSGPVPQGRVDRVSLPIRARWRGGALAVNPDCVTIGFDRVAAGSLVLGRHALPLCPLGGAMVRLDDGRLGGGAQLRGLNLNGALGGSALGLAADRAQVDLARQRFDLSGVALRLRGESETRLDVAALSGGWAAGPAGSFTGLAGQLGAVPLRVSQGAGTWQWTDALALTGALALSDTAEPARFHPLASDNARLRLAGSDVTATATLRTPTGGATVAEVRIAHDLERGAGTAAIEMAGLRFAPDGLQPSTLTPLAFGVVADVAGSVSGKGIIAWSEAGVTSSGSFATDGLDLAAAFGPVRGLKTRLDFVDLLGVRTAPGGLAEVGEVNPGVPVTDGRLRYHLVDSQHVQVEGGRWPFAGGELVLEPTLLDFSESRERRLTFRVVGADAARFLKEMQFDNVDASGTFDGTLPMIFDAQGGRIEGGRLEARAGGSIAYAGEVSRHDLGFWGNMAFQALRSLDYRSLSIGMNGPLAGDMVTEIRFTGIRQGKGTKSNFVLKRLARLPLVFNIKITAPFQQLLSSVQSWYEPSRLIERNLPTLIEESAKGAPVQPPASDTVRQEEQK